MVTVNRTSFILDVKHACCVTMIYSFRTIKAVSEGLYKEKGSKFLSFAFPVRTEADVKKSLEDLRKKYYDARHYCYAYILGAESNVYRANDDGEPNHSAGDPILGQIRSNHLTNVLVVVVRYFGGVKLGVGGLISAYKTAAHEALRNAEIIVREVTCLVTIQYEYADTPAVMRLVKEFDMEVLSQDFKSTCVLQASIKLRKREEFLEKTDTLNATGTLIIVNLNCD
jgi:uncharacterized YigZ family protein